MVHHCDVNKSANTLLGSRRRRLVFIPTSFSHQPLIELWVLPPPYLSHEYCERMFWSVIPLKIRGNLFWASDIIGDRGTISKPTKPCFDLSELLWEILRKLGELVRTGHKCKTDHSMFLVLHAPSDLFWGRGGECDINTIVTPAVSPYPTRYI